MEDTGERAMGDSKKLYDFERIYKYVADEFKDKGESVLDYGCGSGYGSFLLSKYFKNVSGIDVSQEAIDYCNLNFKKDNLHFSVLDPLSQPFPDESFDFIFSFQVFEHVALDQVEIYIQSVKNMLKANGKAIITTPNCNNYHNNFSGNIFHIKEYSQVELETLFSKYIKDVRVLGVEDVLSTKIRHIIRKKGKNSFISRLISKIITTPIRFLESHSIIKTDHHSMIKTKNVNSVVGSLMVEVSKD